jgi:branched-subunit amino acid ABC-type transport system permease component
VSFSFQRNHISQLIDINVPETNRLCRSKRSHLIGGRTIAVHPLTWFVAMMLALLNGSPTVAGVLIFNPLVAIGNSLVLSVFSLIEVGGITVVVGGITGGVIAGLQLCSHCQERWSAVL